jgi:hypothetical protein
MITLLLYKCYAGLSGVISYTFIGEKMFETYVVEKTGLHILCTYIYSVIPPVSEIVKQKGCQTYIPELAYSKINNSLLNTITI